MSNQLSATNDQKLSPVVMSDQLLKLETLKKETERRIKALKSDLLNQMRQNDVLTLKTGKYTISRSNRATPVIHDHQLVKQELEAAGHQVLTKEVIDMNYMKPLVMKFVPDGSEIRETEYISIRITKDKHGKK